MKRQEDVHASRDKAGRDHWDACWEAEPPPVLADPFVPGAGNRVWRRFHEYLRDRLGPLGGGDRKLIEIGCARSIFLPFVARELGFSVSGLDYSEIGCRQTEAMLAGLGIPGEITCGDLFDPPEHLRGAFDVATSFGVVEHFLDTAACLKAVATLVKPGGHVLTVIPNMSGAVGWAQRGLSRAVYDIHVPLTREMLRRAHEDAGLEVLECEYFLFSNFGVCNLVGAKSRSPRYQLKRVALAGLGLFSRAVWEVEERVGDLPTNRWTSPYLVVLARRPG